MPDILRSTLLRQSLLFVLLATAALPLAMAADVLRFSGLVKDPTGALVPGAELTVLNTGTSLSRTTHADAQGFYEFLLPAGNYQLTIVASGFQKTIRDGLTLGPTAPLRLDVALDLASGAENVEVSTSPSHVEVETTNAQVGEAIAQEKLVAVPLNGRSYTDLLALQAGVVPASSAQPNAVVMSGCTSTPPSGDLNPGNMSVSGQRESANGFILNGSSVEEDFNNAASIIPNLDSIDEFRVLTSNFDAEFGNFSGGQVLVTTRTGTNQVHGSAFEFARNTNLDATNYLAHEKATYDRHQFGGTFGAPVVKDHVFLFADYQGTKMTQGQETGNIAVPTTAMRTGDLSSVVDAFAGKTVGSEYLADVLSKRLGRTITKDTPFYTTGCTSNCVFSNGQFPTSAWSAPARALLKYIPQPNVDQQTFSSSSHNLTLTDNKEAARIDWNTRIGNLSAYYFRDDYDLDNPYPTAQGGASVPGFNAISRGRAQLLNLGWTRTFSPTLVNELHLSYMRDSNRIGQPVGGVGPSLASQGFVTGENKPGENTLGIVPLNPATEGIENVSFNDFTMGVDITGERQVNNTYQITENISKVLGRHTFKAGANAHVDQVNIDSNSINNGAFVFQGTETGLDFADFLVGVASTYEQGDAAGFYIRNKYTGLYAQDTWQARSNLTLNYGLRWDMLPPWSEKFNQLQTFVLGQQSEVYPGAPQGMVFPGDKGIASSLTPTHWANFAPRLGLAWSPNSSSRWLSTLFGPAGKSSVHAAYGIFYTAIEGLSAGIMSACPPYGYDYDSTGGLPMFDQPFLSASTGSSFGQPFPSPIPAYGASRKHPNASVDWPKYLPITGDPAFYYRNQSPYTESYTLSLERELAAGTVLDLAYVGTQSHHLLVLTPANPGNAQRCLAVGSKSLVQSGSNVCGPFNEGGLFTASNGAQIEARGPFGPLFDGITYQKTIGSSNYNALEATLKHSTRLTEVMAAYTYSKSIDNSSSLAEEINPIDPSVSRAISAFDVRHNLVVSYHLTLPAAELLHRSNRWTNGWMLAGITRFSSGMPVTLFNNDDTSLIGSMPNGINNNGVDTPYYTPGNLKLNHNPRNGRAAFNTDLLYNHKIDDSGVDQVLGQLSHTPRRFFYGPGMNNFDTSLEKKVDLGDQKQIMLRLEAFNVFNHAQFFGPSAVQGNPDSSNFGQFINASSPRQLQMAVKFSF